MAVPWNYIASPAATVITALLLVGFFIATKCHRDHEGAISRRRLASVFGLSASLYTFLVCVSSELVIKGPHVSELIEHGFGNARISWLLAAFVLDAGFRLWHEYDLANNDKKAVTGSGNPN
ncbi:hypothetical protein [Maritalea sp. S77]|uniref:hypothetical protein n=1 Tax=Maritalea sp. S77 TaxID=3415125 RepID=UPI003C7A3503